MKSWVNFRFVRFNIDSSINQSINPAIAWAQTNAVRTVSETRGVVYPVCLVSHYPIPVFCWPSSAYAVLISSRVSQMSRAWMKTIAVFAYYPTIKPAGNTFLKLTTTNDQQRPKTTNDQHKAERQIDQFTFIYMYI